MSPQDNGPAAAAPAISASIGTTWVSPELRERRRQSALKFCTVVDGVPKVWPGGLEQGFEEGLVDLEPQGDRLLVRVILPEDAAADGLWQADYDSRRAILQQVVRVGPGCAKWWDKKNVPEEKRLREGDYCWILATVSDRLSARDKSLRLQTVRAKYCGTKIIVKADLAAAP